MTPAEAITILRQFNEWRRGDEDIPQLDLYKVGEAIDAAIEMIERLEAAEKSDAESIAMYRKAGDERDALRAENEALAANLRGKHSIAGATYAHLIAERDEFKRACFGHISDNSMLRAKIEAMEKQEPYSYIYEYANPIDGSPVWRDTPGYWNAQYPRSSKPLYALPGARGEEK